ncbi:hypothetical protein glysoja_006431 [Glycine soja]|nr:hypothetical protein glysoja_006431 [Glycine soja]
MEPSEDTIIEVKEEQLMVSPLSGENPIHTTAYFIKPCMEESALCLPHFMLSSGSPLYVVSPSSRVEGARSVNGNDNGVKIKNSSCDTDDVRDKEGEDASHRIVGIASNFESRIEKLERVIAKLEAAKNGQRVQNTGVKAKPSAP